MSEVGDGEEADVVWQAEIWRGDPFQIEVHSVQQRVIQLGRIALEQKGHQIMIAEGVDVDASHEAVPLEVTLPDLRLQPGENGLDFTVGGDDVRAARDVLTELLLHLVDAAWTVMANEHFPTEAEDLAQGRGEVRHVVEQLVGDDEVELLTGVEAGQVALQQAQLRTADGRHGAGELVELPLVRIDAEVVELLASLGQHVHDELARDTVAAAEVEYFDLTTV